MLGLSLVIVGSALAYEQADSLVGGGMPADSMTAPAPAPAPAAAPAGAATMQATPPPATTPAPAAQTTPPPAQTPPPATQAQATTPPPAQQQPTGPFGKGTRRASFTAGWGRSFGEDYLLLGLGVGYFIRNGVGLNISIERWALNDPGVTKLTPELQIVVPRPRGPRPYLAGFWRRAFVEDADDLSSIGGRVGIYNKIAGRSAGGIGAVYEKYLDCDESVYNSCSQVYPEAVFGVSF
jgi:hypothetical protein